MILFRHHLFSTHARLQLLFVVYTVSFLSTDACKHQIHLYTYIETMNDQKMNNLSIDLPYLLLQYMQIMFYALVIIMNAYEHNNQIRKKSAHKMLNISPHLLHLRASYMLEQFAHNIYVDTRHFSAVFVYVRELDRV